MPVLLGERQEGGTGTVAALGTALCLPSAARCEKGYTGARCERVDLFYLRGDQSQIVIISLIVAIVTLIILIVGICLCSQYVGGRGREGANAAQLPWLQAGSAGAAAVGQGPAGVVRCLGHSFGAGNQV